MKPALSMVAALFLVYFNSPKVSGHGRLVDPPSRSSMWRFGFKTKPNYNDNELFCGGYTVHWQRNQGKCGICGDAWHLPTPRPNEGGGTYGRGVIVRKYAPGQVITSTVDITANHRGFFEFKMCPHNNPSTTATQECLDETVLPLADGSGYKYFLPAGTGPFKVKLKLPDYLKCSQCVFQWTYTAGNNWGQCENGTYKVGCGSQETFRGCADVAVGDYETNEIPSYSMGPPRKTPPRPSYEWSVPTKPSRKKRPPGRPSIKPYYVNRGPIPKRKSSTKRPKWQNSPKLSSNTRRTTPRSRYTSRFKYSSTSRKTTPSARRKIATKRTTYTPWYSVSTKRTTYRPWYSSTPRSTNNRPKSTRKPNYSKSPRPPKKPKPPRKSNPVILSAEDESQNAVGGCRAVGAWKSVSGIAAWCNSNCPRGYCPPSHCDCS